MKIRIILGAAAVGGVLSMCVPMHAQMNGHSAAAQAANDPSRNGAMASNNPNQDAEWLKMSTEINNGEIAAGKAALGKSSNADVKQFAQKMVTTTPC